MSVGFEIVGLERNSTVETFFGANKFDADCLSWSYFDIIKKEYDYLYEEFLGYTGFLSAFYFRDRNSLV